MPKPSSNNSWAPGDKATIHRDHMGVALDVEVRVLAVAEGYAMVRRSHAMMPIVVPTADLFKPKRQVGALE